MAVAYAPAIGWAIFVRSYWKDVGWLELCLAAVAKNARGFDETVVVVPRRSAAWLRRITLPRGIRVELCDDYPDDYLGQQVTKLHADLYTDAQVICHLDADCIVTDPMRPADLAPGDKPQLVTRPAQQLGRHWPWGPPTEAFLGWPLERDYMQRPPFVYPSELYAELRAHAQKRHAVSIADYVLACPPRGFSEFNALGAYAHACHRDWFTWLDAEDVPVDGGSWPCRWYSSWEGVESARPEIARLLASTGPVTDACS